MTIYIKGGTLSQKYRLAEAIESGLLNEGFTSVIDEEGPPSEDVEDFDSVSREMQQDTSLTPIRIKWVKRKKKSSRKTIIAAA